MHKAAYPTGPQPVQTWEIAKHSPWTLVNYLFTYRVLGQFHESGVVGIPNHKGVKTHLVARRVAHPLTASVSALSVPFLPVLAVLVVVGNQYDLNHGRNNILCCHNEHLLVYVYDIA